MCYFKLIAQHALLKIKSVKEIIYFIKNVFAVS